jgi:hypothetical protein
MNTNERQIATSPLKICIAFDEAASARSAELLIKHVASDFKCVTQSFQFDELDPPTPCVAAARFASDVDILVIAVRDGRMLPPHVQSWLSLCLGLRDEDSEGALILLVPKATEEPDPDSSLWDYLETVAAIGGLSLFPQRRTSPGRMVEKSGLTCWTQQTSYENNLSTRRLGFN